MTPRNAKTFKQICTMPRDGVETSDHWIVLDDGNVYLHAQRIGEESTQKITLPRATFDAFIDWYNTGKFVAPRKRRKAKVKA